MTSRTCVRTTAAATTVVALMALAAAVSAVPASTASSAPLELSISIHQATKVRAVAAAVAAAARDMLGIDRHLGASALHQSQSAWFSPLVVRSGIALVQRVPPEHRLDERLLDLPPPISE